MMTIIETRSRISRMKRGALVLSGAALFALGAALQDATSRDPIEAKAKPAEPSLEGNSTNRRPDASANRSRSAEAGVSIATYER